MRLNELIRDIKGRAAIAFSGGADSAYLLFAALRAGADVRAYYVRTEFQPRFELEDAKRLAAELGADMRVIELKLLPEDEVASNPPDRCYHCKRRIMSAILCAAREDGCTLLMDGANASDDALDRPGMRAAAELGVISPLRECDLTKADVRRLSKEAGLFTWDKPAYACLATRIPTGERITAQKLSATESAEESLTAMGFRDLRVRMMQGCAVIQARSLELPMLMQRRREILDALKPHYSRIFVDMEARDEQQRN